MDEEEALEPAKPKQDMKELGRRGGLKGGPARAAKLTEQRRREIARLGGIARQYQKHEPQE